MIVEKAEARERGNKERHGRVEKKKKERHQTGTVQN